MKSINKIAFALIASFVSFSCTNLDEELWNVISQDNYGTTTEEMNSLIGPAYGTLCQYINGYFWYGMTAGDDYIIPARGFDWHSGGIYLRAHLHEFNALEANSVYNYWRFSEITTINKIMAMVEETNVEIPNRDRVVAELRGLRAWWYFYMLDKLGNVPIVTSFTDEVPTNEGQTRKDVYDFVVTELEAIVDALNEDVNAASYGKFTKWVCYTLLAKVYINAEVYTGTPQWGKALECLDKVIDSGKYILEPDNNTNFLVKTDVSRENIFVIPYDYDYFRCYFIPYQMSWHYNSIKTFKVRFDCWNGPCATPSIVKSYDKDDKRLGWFMYGPQYASDGTLLTDRNGAPLDITIDMEDFTKATETEGARIFKWEVAENSYNHIDNDFAIFRYVDVLLMKAECLLRLGQDTDVACDIVNMCRKRNFKDYSGKELTGLTLDDILAERGREFIFEGWRCNDLIRFGKYGDPMDFKPNSDPADRHTWVFPIPLSVIENNPKIKQNPGY